MRNPRSRTGHTYGKIYLLYAPNDGKNEIIDSHWIKLMIMAGERKRIGIIHTRNKKMRIRIKKELERERERQRQPYGEERNAS